MIGQWLVGLGQRSRAWQEACARGILSTYKPAKSTINGQRRFKGKIGAYIASLGILLYMDIQSLWYLNIKKFTKVPYAHPSSVVACEIYAIAMKLRHGVKDPP